MELVMVFCHCSEMRLFSCVLNGGLYPLYVPCDWAWPPSQPTNQFRRAIPQVFPHPAGVPAPKHKSTLLHGRADQASKDGEYIASVHSAPPMIDRDFVVAARPV